MRRLESEAGGVAVMVALLIVVLVGMAALVIDVGALFQERRELQNGADAAALAVAYDCAFGQCGDYEATGASYADANAKDGMATVESYEFTSNSVTVTTRTRNADGDAVLHWFAPVLGRDATTVRAAATASWETMGSGTSLPLTISWCEWETMVGDPSNLPSASQTILFHTGSGATDCTGPAGQNTPGGFGWLDPALDGTCTATIDSEQNVDGNTGSGVPSPVNQTGCSQAFFEDLIGQEVLIPIFSSVTNPGSNAYYYIEGFAAFVLEGYRLSGSQYNVNPPCSGSDRCIRGQFVEYIDYGDVDDWGGGDFGAILVGLTG